MVNYLISCVQTVGGVALVLACVLAGIVIIYVLIHVGTSAFYNAKHSVMDRIRENSKGGKNVG